MKAKKVIALVMCAAMVAGMSASSVMAADMPEQFKDLKANEAYDFPMMVKSFQSTYWDAAQEGMKKAADELGVTYKAQGPNSESDIADQVNMINTAIAAKPAGLGLAACDTSSVLDALQECADKGIPVVTFDTGIADAPEGSVVCEVCTDNAQAGAEAATHTGNAMKLLHQHFPAIWGAVLEDDNVYCEIICDGRHLHPGTVRLHTSLCSP